MEKLLAFHLSDTEQRKLKQIAALQKIRLKLIEPSLYTQSIETLVAGTPSPLTAPPAGEIPQESLILMCGLSEQRMDKLLFSLRKNRVQVDYKAILTPTNQKWNVLQLLLEMKAEKAACTKPQS